MNKFSAYTIGLVVLFQVSAFASPVITETTSSSGLKHPGCLQSAAEINALATALAQNDPTRTSYWNSMISSSRGRVTGTDWIPPTDIVGQSYASSAKYAGAGLIRYINDWIINGNTTSEAAAITMLNRWANINSFTAVPGDTLEGQSYASQWWGYLAHAADLLISSGTSWPVEEQQAFKDMMRDLVLPIIDGKRIVGYNANWDLGATWAVMATAVLLDDKALFDEQIAWLKDGETNARLSYFLLSTGQNQESARDQTHACMAITFCSLAVQTAWTQGVDLYEYDNRSLGKAFEFYAAYNQGEDHLPTQVYPCAVGSNSAHDFNTAISDEGRPYYPGVFEMVYHHYKNYRGIELPFCKSMLENHTRREDPGPNWSNHNTALYWNLDLSADAALRNAQSADTTLDINTNYAGRATLRLNCGDEQHYGATDGRAFTKEKSVWQEGGANISHSNPIANTIEQKLYQTYRQGNASGSSYYHFGLPNGEYRVKLHFAEPSYTQANQRTFSVYLEGSKTLDNFDIYAVAGNNNAYTHETVVTLNDGTMDVQLQQITSRAIINAIEIEPVVTRQYILTYTAGPNGTISGTTPQSVSTGADGTTVTAIADEGYRFVGWSDGSQMNPRTDVAIINNISVTVNFAGEGTVTTTNELVLADCARIVGGSESSAAQANTGDLALKDASGNYMRIGMMKADLSTLSDSVQEASLSFLTKNDVSCNIYVWGVVDSNANGWDWTGGVSGDVTWDSVIANGLFTPKDSLYSDYGSELVLLGTSAIIGDGNPYNLTHTISGTNLVELLNADTDDILTLVVAVDANVNANLRNPITYIPTAALQVVTVPSMLDTDGDGLTDAQETALGTDPNDPDSGFGIDGSPRPTTGNVQITWPSATGVLYRVWESPDLFNWSVTRDWAGALTPPEDTIEVDLSPTNGFFRVEAQIQ